jgi:uncharacterized protein
MNNFDWSVYSGNLTWLPARTIYLARHGSHAYGTSLPTSDEDFRGVTVAPAEYYLGALQRFEQAECKTPDLVVFDLRKFISLASQCNPNVIEILFVDDADRLQVTPLGERLLAMRELFLTRRVRHTFSGYAASQLKRIRVHYRWLRNPPSAPPTRAQFDLPEFTLIPADQLAAARAAVQKKLDSWSTDYLDGLDPDVRIAITGKLNEQLAEMGIATREELWPAAARTVGVSDNLIDVMARERRYETAKREWDHFQTWRKQRNPARAELEERFGYDTKHAMHLVRLLRMCREILTTGKVVVRRPDAAELLAIRAGAWEYERIVEWAEREDQALQDVAAQSALPKAPDVHRIDAACVEIMQEAL